MRSVLKRITVISLICVMLVHARGFRPVHSRAKDYLPCEHLKTKQKGVCMFAQYCSLANGTHLTYCIEGFIYKSCCKLPPGVTGVDGVFSIMTNEIEPFVFSGGNIHVSPTEKLSTSQPITENINTTTIFTPVATTIRARTTNQPPSPPTVMTWRPSMTTAGALSTTSPKPESATSSEYETKTTTVTVTIHPGPAQDVEQETASFSILNRTPTINGTSEVTSTLVPTGIMTSERDTTDNTSSTTGVYIQEVTTQETTVTETSKKENRTLGQTVLMSSSTAPPTLNNTFNFKKVCGRPQKGPVGRIVGGETSDFGQWPWMISLRQWKKFDFLHKCGAALLTKFWAITAAHCVENVPSSQLLLRLGEYDISVENEPLNYVERRVQLVASHPKFDRATFEYDIALLRFYEPVKFQRNILPICIPSENNQYVGRYAIVTGWGRLREDGPLPKILQNVKVPVITNRVCMDMYKRAGYNEEIPEIFICAGQSDGNLDSCEGDSGGPMVIQEDEHWVLAGIISWGIGCALPNQPGVYTRISKFSDWINQIIVL